MFQFRYGIVVYFPDLFCDSKAVFAYVQVCSFWINSILYFSSDTTRL